LQQAYKFFSFMNGNLPTLIVTVSSPMFPGVTPTNTYTVLYFISVP